MKRPSYKKLHWDAMVEAKHHADQSKYLAQELESLYQLLAEMWEHTLKELPPSGELARFDYACFKAYLDQNARHCYRENPLPYPFWTLLTWRGRPITRDPKRLTSLVKL